MPSPSGTLALSGRIVREASGDYLPQSRCLSPEASGGGTSTKRESGQSGLTSGRHTNPKRQRGIGWATSLALFGLVSHAILHTKRPAHRLVLVTPAPRC